MSEAARRLKVNRVMEGKACSACHRVLAFGDDAVACSACAALHDAPCWDQRGGCATPACVNAPLQRLKERPRAAAPAAPPLGKVACPHCGKFMRTRDALCPYCKQAPTPDGVYDGPTRNAPDAVPSMVWGIVGLFICGVILGIVAIQKSGAARKAMDADPRLGGRGYATAGLVLGIIDLVLWTLILFVKLSSPGGGY